MEVGIKRWRTVRGKRERKASSLLLEDTKVK